eukprot:246390_1
MDPAVLATLLLSKHENDDRQYKQQVEQEKDKIIELCGGLHNLLQLYLANTMDNDAVNVLHCLFTSRTQTHDNESVCNPHMDRDIKQQTLALSRMEINTAKHLVPPIAEQRRLFAPEIIKVDVCDNIYFHILKSRQSANFVYNKIVKSTYMMVFICVLLLISTISLLFCISPRVHCRDTWYIYPLWSRSIAWILVIVAVLHIFGFNFELMKANMKTFDFNYKLWQGMTLLVSMPFLCSKSGHSSYDVVLFDTIVAVGIVFVSYIDAMSMKMGSKSIVLGICMLLITAVPIWGYFNFEDVLWDPFNGRFKGSSGETLTRISFKSAFLNATTNTVLFLMKPFLSGLRSYCTENEIESALINKGYAKSVVLLSRPFIRWINYDQDMLSLAHGSMPMTVIKKDTQTMPMTVIKEAQIDQIPQKLNNSDVERSNSSCVAGVVDGKQSQ